MGAQAIRMNLNKPFVNGGISASMELVQQQWSYSHEVLIPFRLYDFYYSLWGVLEVSA
ncbi:MAG: hypothetical protein QG578_2102 [Thermodesulfobacteriota bacterium]|nr:hypothetical protein [Thermodesulfobacteriota bacterium]